MNKRVIPMVGLLVGLAVVVTLSVSVGPVRISAVTVWRIIAYHLIGIGESTGWTPIQDNIVWDLRLPRTLLGILVGAGLTVTGIVTQALVRNPLADPYVLGISQGASVGAIASIVLGVGAFGVSSTAGAAFVGAAGSFALVYAFARRGGSMAPLRLVLAGVAIGFAFNGVAQFLILQADTPGETNTALFWLLGSLASASWGQLALPAGFLAAGTLFLVGRGRALNALMAGDETAASLGVGVERLRRQLLVSASLLTGVMVSVSGSISFVGLIVPHALRMMMGTDHRWLIPAGVLGGATFLVAVDVIARVAVQPQELPIGVVTGVVGAPVFLLLMSRRREVGGGR
ncbi:MAG: FecCD family ABC transporter permease [Pseudonocardiaceae bacterium]